MNTREEPGETNPNGRLRWLCRRGMLELDAWLATFLDLRYPGLSSEIQHAFVRLLDQDDMALFDWLTEERQPPAEFKAIVQEIRAVQSVDR